MSLARLICFAWVMTPPLLTFSGTCFFSRLKFPRIVCQCGLPPLRQSCGAEGRSAARLRQRQTPFFLLGQFDCPFVPFTHLSQVFSLGYVDSACDSFVCLRDMNVRPFYFLVVDFSRFFSRVSSPIPRPGRFSDGRYDPIVFLLRSFLLPKCLSAPLLGCYLGHLAPFSHLFGNHFVSIRNL